MSRTDREMREPTPGYLIERARLEEALLVALAAGDRERVSEVRAAMAMVDGTAEAEA